MLYAKVVFGLAVKGPFDYSVGQEFRNQIIPGSRVLVPFRTQQKVGYVVKLCPTSNIKKTKAILELIDRQPLLNTALLNLCQNIADYYCCNIGEVIETAIPARLRTAKKIELPLIDSEVKPNNKSDNLLFHCADNQKRWSYYLERVKNSLKNKNGVIIILPDVNSIPNIVELIKENTGISADILYRGHKFELELWLKIRSGRSPIIIGTRSAVFAPLEKPGLIILDEEENPVYKQDQVPHYHARDVALMRSQIQGCDVVLGTASPSLEAFYLYRKKEIRYIANAPRQTAQVKIIDISRQRSSVFFSRSLQDAIAASLVAKQKTLIFLNRKGFATAATCRQCGFIFKCPRCNVNLVLHYKNNILSCHYCSHKEVPVKICPKCNAGYIQYSGLGGEKIESEIAKIFPQAKIKIVENEISWPAETDIVISTQTILKKQNVKFDITGMIGIDNLFNRPDFRSTERIMRLLEGLNEITREKLIVQTRFPTHYSLTALAKHDPSIFYTQELNQRKQLKFPPFTHFILIKIRSPKEDKVKQAGADLFEKLSKFTPSSDFTLMNLLPSPNPKLRGNYYWQILLKSNNPAKCSKLLKKQLTEFLHSGIIVTVDVDPI